MFKTVLCAIDLADESDELVVKYGAELARGFGARLVLLYAVDSSLLNLKAGAGPLKLDEDHVEALQQAAQHLRSQAEDQLRKMVERLDVTAEWRILEGPSVSARILEGIDQIRPDVVVIGSHSKGKLRRLIVGSVCDKVVHTSPVPVMVVKLRPEAWRSGG